MIQLPRRNVTRFFIPLIDVLILLVSMFLLVPQIRESDLQRQAAGAKAKGEDPESLKAEVRRLQRDLDAAAKAAKLTEAAIRVLEVDPANGKLFHYAPGPRPTKQYLETEQQARTLIARLEVAEPGRRLHFLILLPRVDSAFPEQRQLAEYQKWFRGRSLSIDRPVTVP
jgi:hypothetical protein